jgi:hypothetical protein
MATATMQEWAHLPLYFDHLYRLVIYHLYGCALPLAHSQVASHLWEKHQIPPEQQKGLTHFIERRAFHEPSHTAPPEDGYCEHPALWTYNGFSCRQCSY